MDMRILKLLLFLVPFCTSLRSQDISDDYSIDEVPSNPSSSSFMNTKKLERVLPSKKAIEMIGVKFLDAIIKKGQMEMAKGAFKTQLEVLQKVNPDQYNKYKNLKVEDLAADAVMQQAQLAGMQPKTGNAFVDMLHENGIPIGSSLKGIEQAMKTQKEIENNDPSEQIAKAVFDKFREQILPGLVANMISGRNPFKMPGQMRPMQPTPELMRQQAMMMQQAAEVPGSFTMTGPSGDIRMSERSYDEKREQTQEQWQREEEEERGERNEREESLEKRLRQSPRLAALLRNPSVASLLYSRSRVRDAPLGRSLSDRKPEYSPLEALGARSSLALGMNDMFGDDEESEEIEETAEIDRNGIRRAPLSLNSEFVRKLREHGEIAEVLNHLNYKVDDVENLLLPKKRMFNPSPQPGFTVPRKIPKRARKMIPLLVGVPDVGSMNTPFGPIRRAPSSMDFKPATSYDSRVLRNLKNNPNIAPLFMDQQLDNTLRGRQMLTPEQKGMYQSKRMMIQPRLFGAKLQDVTDLDRQVKQVIEERPVPPVFFIPRGRHTRIRWTGATEKEIPGIGTRMILPSLDPTAPAVNTAYSTQGRSRDEWDTMFKVPNEWKGGDEVGFSVKQKSERFIGGTGNFDMPAAGM